MFYFDGESNVVEVLENRFNYTLRKYFIIMIWMKYEYVELKDKKYRKEYILCMFDGESKYRYNLRFLFGKLGLNKCYIC